jgi:hypothetical protein
MDVPVSIRAYARDRKSRGLPIGSHEGIRRAIAAGALLPPAVTEGGKISAREADAQLAEAHPIEASLNGKSPSPSRTDGRPLSEIRAEREALRLKREHLAYHRAAGELIEAQPVLRALEREARALRDRMLTLPQRVHPTVADLPLREAMIAWEAAIGDAFDDFAQQAEQVVTQAVERERARGTR